MSTNAINSENILHNYGGNNVNSLSHILDVDVDDELHLLQKSQYFDDETLLKQIATKTNTFKILSLNCQSINAKIDQLKIKIQQYKNDNCEFSAICLQETWVDINADTSLLQNRRLHSYTTRQNVQRSWRTPNISTQTL